MTGLRSRAFRARTPAIDADEPARAPERDASPRRRLRAVVVMRTIEAGALLFFIAARQFGLVAQAPLWLYAAVIVIPVAVNRWLDRLDVRESTWRLDARIGFHAATVMAVIYLTGWGPALSVCFVYTAIIDLSECGPESWSTVLGWSLGCVALGQLLVLAGWAPSKLDSADAQALGVLGAIGLTLAIRIAGAIATDKQRAEDKLAHSEAHYRALVEHAGDGIFTIDLDGRVLSFNRAAESIFGWSADEIIDRSVTALITPDWRDGLLRFLSAVRVTGDPAARYSDVEMEGLRKDGTAFPFRGSTSSIGIEGASPIISCIVRDLSEQKRYEATLSRQALHDSLTALPNRLLLMDRLAEALARTRRHHRMCAVLYIDLDRFKTVNDKLGHAGGDQLLIAASERIKDTIRESDTLARIGGDEFVILCDDLEEVQAATNLAERVIAAVREPFQIDDDDAFIGASVGIAVSFDGIDNADTLLRNADIAMYRAKDKGRNRFELFDEAMQRWVSNNAALESDLRQAIARNEFLLVYQPIISTETGHIRGFEALLRWNRPGMGIITPDHFIPMAEETGLITEIGAWVIAEACREAATWSRRWPDRHLGLALNISNRQLMSTDIKDVIKNALDASGVDPQQVTLELTESTLIDDSVNAQVLLRELRGLGLNLSLDDFGTGYSSLTYLRAFPFTAVKIDRSFIRSLGTEREDTAIVTSVIGLAKNLRLAAVAEGVEQESQLAVLIQLGCAYVQGNFFSEPRPAEDIEGLLQLTPEDFMLARVVDAPTDVHSAP